MIDVSDKSVTCRRATAGGFVKLSAATVAAIRGGSVPKGDVLGTARIAGIMAAKRTAHILPLCHQVPLSQVVVDLEPTNDGVAITATATAQARTGVEMEALVAVTTAALTVYDMVKSLDRGAVLHDIGLLEKSGGRSGNYVRKGK